MSHRRPMNIRAMCGSVVGSWSRRCCSCPAAAQAAPPANDNFANAINLGSGRAGCRVRLQPRRHHRDGRPAAARGLRGDRDDLVAVDGACHGVRHPGGHVRHPADPVREPWRCSPAPPSASLANATSVGSGRTPADVAPYQGGEGATTPPTSRRRRSTRWRARPTASRPAVRGGSTSSNIVLRVSRPAPNDNFASATDLGSAVPAVGTASNIGASTEVDQLLQPGGAFGATGYGLVAVDGSRHGPLPGGHVLDTLPALSGKPWRRTPDRWPVAGQRHVGGDRVAPRRRSGYQGGECDNSPPSRRRRSTRWRARPTASRSGGAGWLDEQQHRAAGSRGRPPTTTSPVRPTSGSAVPGGGHCQQRRRLDRGQRAAPAWGLRGRPGRSGGGGRLPPRAATGWTCATPCPPCPVDPGRLHRHSWSRRWATPPPSGPVAPRRPRPTPGGQCANTDPAGRSVRRGGWHDLQLRCRWVGEEARVPRSS